MLLNLKTKGMNLNNNFNFTALIKEDFLSLKAFLIVNKNIKGYIHKVKLMIIHSCYRLWSKINSKKMSNILYSKTYMKVTMYFNECFYFAIFVNIQSTL